MQFFLYLIVGGLSFFIELAAFIGLRSASVAVIPASVASFIIATAANYLLSITLAFVPGRFRRGAEVTLLHGSAAVAGQGSIGAGWNPVNNRKPRDAVQTPRQTPSSYRETALSAHERAGI